jgi:hypothetical protein
MTEFAALGTAVSQYCGLAGVQQAITGFGSLLRAI